MRDWRSLAALLCASAGCQSAVVDDSELVRSPYASCTAVASSGGPWDEEAVETITTTYDEAGRPVEQSTRYGSDNSAGQHTGWGYDADGRLVTVWWDYDGDGRVETLSAFRYDERDRLVEERRERGDGALEGVMSHRYEQLGDDVFEVLEWRSGTSQLANSVVGLRRDEHGHGVFEWYDDDGNGVADAFAVIESTHEGERLVEAVSREWHALFSWWTPEQDRQYEEGPTQATRFRYDALGRRIATEWDYGADGIADRVLHEEWSGDLLARRADDNDGDGVIDQQTLWEYDLLSRPIREEYDQGADGVANWTTETRYDCSLPSATPGQ